VTPFPTGNETFIASKRFRCPGFLLKPSLNRFEFCGIGLALFDSIMKCDVDVRIEKEIIRLAPPTMKSNVVAPPEWNSVVWIGESRKCF
jgi:actin-related protein